MRKLGWVGVLVAIMGLTIYRRHARLGTGAGRRSSTRRLRRSSSPRSAESLSTYKAPRTPWGDPDLQGVWSSDDMQSVPSTAARRTRRRLRARTRRPGRRASAAGVRLLRHRRLRRRPAGPPPLYLDDAALKARQDQITAAARRSDSPATDGSFRFDYARRAFPQTRLLVDPPDGRMPNVRADVANRGMPRGTYGPGPLNSWMDFSLYERCITRGIGGSILHVIYGNGNRIVQAPGVVAFSYEMLPDTRIFYTDGRPHVNQKIGMYLGDSRARWEGEELVVETTNLTDQTAFGVNGNGTQHSKAMKITERFRRVADDIVQYQATWDDPLTYERAIHGVVPADAARRRRAAAV